MWETQPYVEEISVEFWPFLDFLSSDNRGVRHAHALRRTQTHNQFPHLPLFSLKLWRVLTESLSILHIEQGLLRLQTVPSTQKHAHTFTGSVLLSLAPHLAFLSCTARRGHRDLVALLSQLTFGHPSLPPNANKKESNLLTGFEVLKWKSLDTKRQKDKRRMRSERKAPENQMSEEERGG